jgi:hypothetical protein
VVTTTVGNMIAANTLWVKHMDVTFDHGRTKHCIGSTLLLLQPTAGEMFGADCCVLLWTAVWTAP